MKNLILFLVICTVLHSCNTKMTDTSSHESNMVSRKEYMKFAVSEANQTIRASGGVMLDDGRFHIFDSSDKGIHEYVMDTFTTENVFSLRAMKEDGEIVIQPSDCNRAPMNCRQYPH